jgi:hypothetical protein
MHWSEGTIVEGGNEQGNQSNQFYYLSDLSFDRKNNLYVVDVWNNRVQNFVKSSNFKNKSLNDSITKKVDEFTARYFGDSFLIFSFII